VGANKSSVISKHDSDEDVVYSGFEEDSDADTKMVKRRYSVLVIFLCYHTNTIISSTGKGKKLEAPDVSGDEDNVTYLNNATRYVFKV